MRQSITAHWSVIPWDLCTVPAKINRKSNWHPMNFIPFEVFSMGVFVNAMVPPFLERKNHCSIFHLYCPTASTLYESGPGANISEQSERIHPKMYISFGGRSDVSIVFMTSIC
jgi:hypothetical protein